MRLATLTTQFGTIAARIDGEVAVPIAGFSSVSELIQTEGWAELAAGATATATVTATATATDGAPPTVQPIALDSLAPTAWAAVVPTPSKIVCVGLNYRSHIREMGREIPEHPTLFAKYPEALIGAFDPIEVPSFAADAVDWEGELGVVIGRRARNVAEADAAAYIAGYTVLNDVTMRDYQYRTPQWLQGKTFENTTPVGPVLVTPDEFDPTGATLRTVVDGETVQEIPVGDLVFTPTALIAYISSILTLNPGDLIATGTPGGVGHAHTPPRYLTAGSVVETTIDGLGTLRNVVVVK